MQNYLIKSRLKYSQASDLYLVDNPNIEKDVTTALGIVRNDYQGKSFEGRPHTTRVPPLINCLRSSRKAIAATFGEDVSPNYDDVIKEFGSTF